MKLLTSEQQEDLQKLFVEIEKELDSNPGLQSSINYWLIELKPKRVRRKSEVTLDSTTTS